MKFSVIDCGFVIFLVMMLIRWNDSIYMMLELACCDASRKFVVDIVKFSGLGGIHLLNFTQCGRYSMLGVIVKKDWGNDLEGERNGCLWCNEGKEKYYISIE